MLLSEYFAEIVKLIEEFSRTNLIVRSDLSHDLRTEKVGSKGASLFSDMIMLRINQSCLLKAINISPVIQ